MLHFVDFLVAIPIGRYIVSADRESGPVSRPKKENMKSEKMSRVARGLKMPDKSDAEILAANRLDIAKVVQVAPHGDERWTWNVIFGRDSGVVGAVAFRHTRTEAQRVADEETV